MSTLNGKEKLSVTILGRPYTLLCTSDEKSILLAAVALVDQKMHTIHDHMGLTGHDKIAVFAALQIANDFLQLNLKNTTHLEASDLIERMGQRVDHAINPPLNPLL